MSLELVETQTITGMTSIFTPPADCVNSWTYEDSYYNDMGRGILIQNALPSPIDGECFPLGFAPYDKFPRHTIIFSPGACPQGYETVEDMYNDSPITTAVCCPSAFDPFSTISNVKGIDSTAMYYGCTSSFVSQGFTKVLQRTNNSDLVSTSINGPLKMWAQPITIAFREVDKVMFTPSSPPITAATAPSTASPTAQSLPTASSIAADPPIANAQSSSDLSEGALAGVIIGAISAASIIVGLALVFVLRTRKSRRALPGKDQDDQAGQSPSVAASHVNQFHDTHRAPTEMEATRKFPPEMEASQSFPGEMEASRNYPTEMDDPRRTPRELSSNYTWPSHRSKYATTQAQQTSPVEIGF